MKVLVTGGAGFIASHIADALVAAGHDVHVIDNLVNGRRENLNASVTFHEMDICDPAVGALWAAERFEVMVHHAAQMDVRKSVADPAFDAGVNILGFLNLMEAGRKNGLAKVVFASTGGAIYGEPDYVPQDEKHTLQPLSPYGITKLTTEKYLFFYQNTYGIPYVGLRYANVYGPRQNPHGEAGVVSIFTNYLLDGKQPVIYGDGLQTRDYVYVGDVVRANMAAFEYPGSGLFNVGTGIETTVNQLFGHIRALIAPEAPEAHAPGRPGEQHRSVLSYRLTEDTLGWRPKVALKDGIAATVRWFKEQRSL